MADDTTGQQTDPPADPNAAADDIVALDDLPTDDPADPKDGGSDPKAETRAAFEARKARERAEKAEKELAQLKAAEQRRQREAMTEQQQRDADAQVLRDENDRLKREALVTEVGIELKLPRSMWDRLIGNDKEALMADGENLSKIIRRPAAGSATDPARDTGKIPEYTREQLRRDPKLARQVSADIRSGKARVVG